MSFGAPKWSAIACLSRSSPQLFGKLFNVCTQTLQELLFPLGGAGHFLFHLVQVLGNRRVNSIHYASTSPEFKIF